MKTRLIGGPAALLALLSISSAAKADFFAWTPVSGAAFRTAEGSPAFPTIQAGQVMNNSTTQPAVIEASVGHQPAGVATFLIYGTNNGQSLQCTIFAWEDIGMDTTSASGTDTTNGNFLLSITIDTRQFPNESFFFSAHCALPPSTSLFGVRTNGGTGLLMPAAADAFVPVADPAGPAVEVSLGYYGGGSTGFVLNGKVDGNTLTCKVHAWNPTTGLATFSNSVTADGWVGLVTVASTSVSSFFTMHCVLPPGFILNGDWPGH